MLSQLKNLLSYKELLLNFAKKELKVKGEDLESLMFNWLNALLVYVDGENLAFSKFDIKINEKKNSLKAICKGEKIDRKKHETRTVVKAATMHLMQVIKVNIIWKARVIVDI
mgnify:CR=1 FL=1